MPNTLIERIRAKTQRIIDPVNSAIAQTNFQDLEDAEEFDLALSHLQNVYKKALQEYRKVQTIIDNLNDEDKGKINKDVEKHFSRIEQLESDIKKIKKAFNTFERFLSNLAKKQTLDFDSINEKKLKI